ncbi:tRNA (N(6)-L-threonylcarbamoyladenosine(37)-C(2))-methylthiotransferase MtaB [Arenicella xantha]|uniref:tRNA (N(6)-L-threonylcarbamoyladenosine(37)-C(2))-methylthiotransferase n=1 Tax=Arenicella xantha TaxID=644221 RepID=A0A395JH98_9GAMM|nr:tRNA (N(6)-L-threonylcarbamoyladenosine(37)-C(2))-methylthiotransferase MtaB [Arenicella xantha]RBP49286.1 threonylcarbamoyladenosine tRNA methylthiotransferase MtaB [Arenicella xantha]
MASIEIKLDQIGRRGESQPAIATPYAERSHDAAVVSSTPSIAGKTKAVGITTLGCKVNTYESELIAETLKTSDWQVVANTEKADLYLINTCTVTREADRQARQEVRKAIKRNPDALVVVTGCYAQMDPQACAEIPGVDLVLGNDRKLDVHSLLPALDRGELPKVMVGDLDQHVSLPEQLVTGFEAHTRAFVQIQQGCDQGCTFCIIHVARGPSRSLAPSLIKRQVQRLVLNGYPEVVICGVDLGSYGDDFVASDVKFDLVDLLQELLSLEYDPDNPFRIRLSSIDPHHITERLIELWAREPRICAHMHLSLQSGNDLILKRMKRRYSGSQVRERIHALRAAMPELVISADVMVGFPTETEAQYQDTEQMLSDIQVAFPHTFSYSERSGTPAARIPAIKQVPVVERKDRNARLRKAAQPIQSELRASRVGSSAWVLPEKLAKDASLMVCRAEDYLAVLVPANQVQHGKWVKVHYHGVENDYLLANSL